MDETETILKPETKTERRLITMILCTPVYLSADSLYEDEQGGTAMTARGPRRKSYRVGPKDSSWPKILTVNPYEQPQVCQTSGPAL
jgi:hypothetical protein